MSWSQESNHKLYDFEYPASTIDLQAERVRVNEKSQDLPDPHLQLAARLSQIWLNQWTILLILVLVRLLFAARTVRQNINSGLADLTVACRELQVASSTAVSMPHYLAQGTNSLIKHSIDGSVSGLSYIAISLLTAVEELVLFLVDTFKNTYLCLLKFAINGSLDSVVNAVEEVGDYVNSTLSSISKDITAGVSDANQVLNKISSIIEKAASFLGENIDIPTINITQVSELQNLHLPTSFDTDLEALRDSLNLDALQNATDDVIRLPFEKLKVLVAERLGNYSFDQNLLSVPASEQLDFCSNSGLTRSFEELSHAIFTTYHILLVVLVIAAVLAMIPHAWLEWWKWRSIRLRSTMTFSSIRKAHAPDVIDLVQIASNPLSNLLGLTLASRFRKQKSQNLARWYLSYITHKPAIIVLSIAVAGLVACALQGLMLVSLEHATPSLAQDIGNVSALVQAKLLNSSAAWANHTNSQINATQNELNQDLFGWVNTSTIAVNDTLNLFTDTLVDTLNRTFGGTVLYQPILEVLDCIILLKLQGIESGLTWVRNEAHISLPAVPTDVFAMTQSDSSAMFGQNQSSTAEDVTNVLDALITMWRASIKEEAYVAGSLMLAWLVIAIAGLIRVLVDARRTVKPPAAFSSCFIQDVKQCISRPKQSSGNEEEVRITQ